MYRSMGVPGISTQFSFWQESISPSWTASGSSPPPEALSLLTQSMISVASVKSLYWVTQEDSWGGWSRYVTTANLRVIPSVRTLFSIFLMMATMVDCTCASSPLMDPVASTQKQTSTNPKAGRGRLSREEVLKMVALVGLIDRSMLRVRMTVLPVEAGRTAGAEEAGREGREGLAGRVGILVVLGRCATFLGLADFFGLTMPFPSSMVLAMVLVLVMRLGRVALRQSSPSATQRSMEEVLLSLVGLTFLAILIKYKGCQQILDIQSNSYAF